MTEKHAFFIEKEIYDTIMVMYKRKNYSCVSDLVNVALNEYLAREHGQAAIRILSKEAVSVIENAILLSERRINRMLFKLAVGDAELKRVIAIASRFKTRIHLMDEIHEQSLREVRITNGILNLKNTLEHTNDDDIERYSE
ncbi:MAG: hypothetical protein J5845_01565 [Lachnospiraceae bacterium]|nr:hypothetical protein [Lachnospiraceae bacterium]MBR5676884.1 hypothetical protein [Paludibacteraceae bacterium]